jgi:hypothetical protein
MRRSLFRKGAKTLLRIQGDGDIAEILHGVRDAASIIAIDLSHEGCASHPHDGFRLRRKLSCEIHGSLVERRRIRPNAVNDA